MASIGNITVHLTALTGRFSKGMRRAAGEVATFTASVSAASARLAAMSTAAAGVAVGALALLTARQMEAIDSTAKVADRLGESTEALLGMRYAADLAGVGAEEFDKAMEKLSKTLGNPTQDSGEALTKIGLSTEELLRMSPAQRFSAIADGIGKLGSQADKAAVATALFGKTGANLLNTMDRGSAGLAEDYAELIKLSGVYSRSQAAMVEEANDSWTKIKKIITGVGDQLAILASPLITEVANGFTSMGTDGESASSKIVNGMANVAKSILRVVDLIDVAVAGFLALGAVGLKAKSMWESAQADVAKGVAETVNFFAPGTIDQGFIDSGIADQKQVSADTADQALKAYVMASEKLTAALNGDRSQGIIDQLTTAYDKIAAGAADRAKTSTDKLAADRKAAAAAEVAATTTAWNKLLDGLDYNALHAIPDGIATVINGFKIKSSGFLDEFARSDTATGAGRVDMQTAVRGTFSGEAAGRQSGVATIQTKQLEQQRMTNEHLGGIRAALAGGIAIP